MVGAFYLGAVVLALALASLAVWSRRRLMPRLFAVVAAGLFLPLAYAAFSELLSQPKPVRMEWIRAEAKEAKVLGADMQENVAIYLWLKLPGLAEPRAYVLPWSRQLAQQLQQAMREAQGRRTDVRMRGPFRRHTEQDSEAVFYATPQEALPPKTVAGAGPMILDRAEDAEAARRR